MSALTTASVSAVLKNIVENGLVSRGLATGLGETIVSVKPPDLISTGPDERPQLNLFLYQVAPHAALKTTKPNTVPPLALELHYLITAYGAQEFQIDVLLGYVMHLLHETPVISKDAIRVALKAFTSSPGSLLANNDLLERVDSLKVTPQFLDADALSRLWSALQARYRPSVAYKVSLVNVGRQNP
jgi:Pvc16 N-terminal domain